MPFETTHNKIEIVYELPAKYCKKGVHTEQDLFELFKDVKKSYTHLSTFEIKAPIEKSFFTTTTYTKKYKPITNFITNFKQFLEHATGLKDFDELTLTKKGDVLDLGIDSISIDLDLSSVRNNVYDWDKGRDGSCEGCKHYKQHKTLAPHRPYTTYYCNTFDKEIRDVKDLFKKNKKQCTTYSPQRTNANGKPAKTLRELVDEFVEES